MNDIFTKRHFHNSEIASGAILLATIAGVVAVMVLLSIAPG
jgi:hypothetical protein